ncbi:MAG: putative ABC-type ATPase [Saprospiraceae bacterium]|jgi:predicted ABC-type ATPase
MKPKLIIVAGANGSGKTTFAMPYTQEKGYPFLNADEIAKELTARGEPNAMLKAGRIFFKNLDEWLTEKKSFVVETTLSGKYIKKVAERAKKNGYEVQMIYLFLENENICVDRVKSRVKKGGHDVAVEDIKRRYFRSKRNFWENFRKTADSWKLIFNGENSFELVASSKNQNIRHYNKALLELFHKNYKA